MTRTFAVGLAPAILLAIALPLHGQDDALRAEGEARFRTSLAAWSAGDIEAILSGSTRLGFGYRRLAPRGTSESDVEWSRDQLIRFFESLEYYRARVDEIHTAVHGDVVVVWGLFTEDFKHRGRDPEVYRVRFSSAMFREEGNQLRTVLNHRDIQTFDKRGRYLPQYR